MWDFHQPLEQSTTPLNRGSNPFPFWSRSHFYYAFVEARLPFLLESFVRYLRIYRSIDTTKFSSHDFALGFSERPQPNGESTFFYYKLMIFS